MDTGKLEQVQRTRPRSPRGLETISSNDRLMGWACLSLEKGWLREEHDS